MRILERIDSQREAILRIAARHGADDLRLFGSAARGEERPGSDLDILVRMAPGRSLLDLIGLEQDLEDLLDCPVDVVVEGGISPYLEPSIRAEARPL